MEKKRIGPEIRRLGNLIKREAEKSAARAELDSMTGLHGWVLGFLAREKEPVYQRDLEKRFSWRRSTASNIISLMEKNGLVERRPSRSDARLKEIVLTEKGLRQDRLIRADLDMLETRLSAGIDPRELEAFFKTIEKIKENIEREQNDA